MSIKLSIIISVVVTLFLIFYYKQANKKFDKIFGIKRTDKKSKKIHYRNFIYIIPVMFLLFLDYTSGISNVKLLSEVGLYQIILYLLYLTFHLNQTICYYFFCYYLFLINNKYYYQ